MIQIPYPLSPKVIAEDKRQLDARQEARSWLRAHPGIVWVCAKCKPRKVERLHPPEMVRVWRMNNRFTDTCDNCEEWSETEPYWLRSILEALL